VRHGSNLVRRGATYYARQAVPQDLQGHIHNDAGRRVREFRRSLATKDKAEARRRLPAVLHEWQTLFDEQRARLATCSAMPQISIPVDVEHRLLRRLYDEVLHVDGLERQGRKTTDENLDRLREIAERFHVPADVLSRVMTAVVAGNGIDVATELDACRALPSPRGTADELFSAVIDVYLAENAAVISAAVNETLIEEMREALGRGNSAGVRELAQRMLEKAGFNVVPGSPAALSFAHKVQRVMLEAWERRGERDRGDFRGAARDPLLVDAPVTIAAPAEVVPTVDVDRGRSLEDYFNAYERENRNNLKQHSLAQAHQTIQLFRSYVGKDKRVATITKADVAEWTDCLREFPARAAQIARFRGLDFHQVIEANRELSRPVLRVKTVRRMVSELSSLFGWMENRGYISSNPARGLMPRMDRSSQTRRRSFRHNELTQFFQSSIYLGKHDLDGGSSSKAEFWMPLLALLTGARMGELAQLHTADVSNIDDIWFITITDIDHVTGNRVGDKSLKTLSSRRVVPLHGALLQGGFIKFVEAQKARHPRLFPELVRNRRGEFGDYSRGFGRYMNSIGLTDNTLTFHSFRHTFMDALRRGGVKIYERELLAGHARHRMNDQYGEEVDGSLRDRAAWVGRLDFGEFNPVSIFEQQHTEPRD
jgi:integrase